MRNLILEWGKLETPVCNGNQFGKFVIFDHLKGSLTPTESNVGKDQIGILLMVSKVTRKT
jgi:hypothetical protein